MFCGIYCFLYPWMRIFTFDKNNPILKALDFGTGIKRREKAIREMEILVAREGLRIISEKEYQEFIKWKEQVATQ